MRLFPIRFAPLLPIPNEQEVVTKLTAKLTQRIEVLISGIKEKIPRMRKNIEMCQKKFAQASKRLNPKEKEEMTNILQKMEK